MTSLIVSVDVEADRPRGEVQARTTLRNLEGLGRLHRLCERFGVPPSYLVSYPALNEADALAQWHADGACEIGALLEPWTTPPFDANEDRLIPRTAAELPASTVAEKVARLTEALTERFGARPRSHRAAGLGLNGALLQCLERLDYRVDSSVAPFVLREGCGVDWRDAPEGPYFPDRQQPVNRGTSPILEVPQSVGWDRELLPAVARGLVHAPARVRRLSARASQHLPVPQIIHLDPSVTELKPLRRLAHRIAERGLPCLNLTLRSPQCWPGESAACPEPADVEALFERIEGLLRYVVDELRATPRTLSGFAEHYLGARG